MFQIIIVTRPARCSVLLRYSLEGAAPQHFMPCVQKSKIIRNKEDFNMAEKVIIYGKNGWPYTDNARSAYGEHAQYKDIKAERGDLEEMLEYSGGVREVPVIVEGEKVTIGYGGTWGVWWLTVGDCLHLSLSLVGGILSFPANNPFFLTFLRSFRKIMGDFGAFWSKGLLGCWVPSVVSPGRCCQCRQVALGHFKIVSPSPFKDFTKNGLLQSGQIWW